MGRFRAGIVTAVLALFAVIALGTTYTYTRKEAAETIPVTWNFSAGVKSPLRVAVDYTMATPSVGPTAAAVSSSGSCVSGSQPYRFYYIPINEAGTTGLSPASGDVSGFSAIGTPIGRATVTRGTLPSNAKGWVGAWSRQGGGEAHSIIRLCDAVTSYEQGFKSTGTASFNCSCNNSGLTISPTNQTGVKNLADVNTIAHGYLGIASFAGGNFNFITEDTRRLDISGTFPRFSSDGGTNYGTLLTMGRTVTVCASGCGYTSITDACANNTATSSSPLLIWVAPGNYSENPSCSGQDHLTILGSGRGVTNITGVSQSGGVAGVFLMGTSKNYVIDGFTVSGKRTIYQCGSGTCGSGTGTGGGNITIRNNEFITTTNDALEDCFFFEHMATGTTILWDNNTCTTNADGLTYNNGESGNAVSVFSHNNTFLAGADRFTGGAFTFVSTPTVFHSIGDTIKWTATNGTTHLGLDGVRYLQQTPGCTTGCYGYIQGATIRINNLTAGFGGGSFSDGVLVESTVTNPLELRINDTDILLVAANSAETTNNLGVTVNSTSAGVNVIMNGGRVRTSGAASNTDLNLAAGSATLRNVGVDFVSTSNTVIAQFRSPYSTAPPSAECDEANEVGKLWWDTDADTDGQMFGCKGAAGWKAFGAGGGGGTPGGANTQVQFNDSGVFGGDAGMTYVKATDALTVVGTVTGGDFVTAATTAGSLVMSEASANGTESITLRSGAARTNSLIVDWPDINVTDTAALLAATQTFTNKTIDAEGTGNDITTVSKVWLPTATCQNATASINWDTPTTNAPQAACVTGTNTQKAYLDFDQTTDESVQTVLALPADWVGAIDATYFWLTSATTATSVDWCLQIICVADAVTDDPAFPAQAAGNCVSDAVKGVANQMNTATKTGITATGCTAGSIAHLKLSRDADGTGGTDDTLADARLVGVELTLRRKQ